ncbi:hypothetical protein APR08_004404 [Nocardia amikacinitolerans]|nr:hypothetical protein [Nocardia amikacinitolerans]
MLAPWAHRPPHARRSSTPPHAHPRATAATPGELPHALRTLHTANACVKRANPVCHHPPDATSPPNPFPLPDQERNHSQMTTPEAARASNDRGGKPGTAPNAPSTVRGKPGSTARTRRPNPRNTATQRNPPTAPNETHPLRTQTSPGPAAQIQHANPGTTVTRRDQPTTPDATTRTEPRRKPGQARTTSTPNPGITITRRDQPTAPNDTRPRTAGPNPQNAASSNSMMSLSIPANTFRVAVNCGNTFRAKNFATATFPE